MLSSLHLEDVAYRFQPFVGELRSFLKQNEVAYGFPEHLLSFTERLTGADSLREDVSAKLLEVMRGSSQPASHGELVELLLVTVGGAMIDEDTPTVQKAERVLSQLVGEVMTSRDGLLSMQHVVPAAPIENAAETPEEILGHSPALDTAEPEIVLQPQPLAREARAREGMAWASPPNFVWAAMLCGVLLPPCMYFLSRPHAAERAAAQSTSTSATHTAVRPRALPDLVLPRPYEMKPLDLDFGDEPAPHRRSHGSLRRAAVSHTGSLQSGAEPNAGTGAGADASSSR